MVGILFNSTEARSDTRRLTAIFLAMEDRTLASLFVSLWIFFSSDFASMSGFVGTTPFTQKVSMEIVVDSISCVG